MKKSLRPRVPATARSVLQLAAAFVLTASICACADATESPLVDKYGAVYRGDTTKKSLALVFTGDEFGESTEPILSALDERHIKGGFFVTGKFVAQPTLRNLLEKAIAAGHYVGPHSDTHPLYCPWEDRKKTLVTEDFFKSDLQKNIDALKRIGALQSGQSALFIPPYEYHNSDQTRWAKELGVTLINFTPGSRSNRDYAREGDPHFVSSRQIYEDIFAYERKDPNGLNGYIMLMHLGSGRKDPLHPLLGELCDTLTQRGYKFERVDELIGGKNQPERASANAEE